MEPWAADEQCEKIDASPNDDLPRKFPTKLAEYAIRLAAWMLVERFVT
jgi:hypothetical protein